MKKNKKNKGIIILAVVFVVLVAVYLLIHFMNQKAEEAEEAAEEETEAVFSIEEDEIASISFYISDEEIIFTRVESEDEDEDDTWSCSEDEDFPVDTSSVTSMLSYYTEITPNRTLSDVDDADEYGFDDPANLVTITDADGGETTILIGATNSSTGDCYICLNDDSSTIYTVDSGVATAVEVDLLDFAESSEFVSVEYSDIYEITVDKEEDSYSAVTVEDTTTGWEVTTDDDEVLDASSSSVMDLQEAIASLTFVSFYEYNCTDYEAYGLDDPYAVITFSYEVEVESEEDEEEDDEDTEEDTDEEEEVETEQYTVTIYVGDEADEGERYVYVDGSTEVHTMYTDYLDVLTSTAGGDLESLLVGYISIYTLDSLTIEYDDESHVFEMNEVEVVVESDDEDDTDDDSDDTDESTDEDSEETETETQTVYTMDGEEISSLNFSIYYNSVVNMMAQETTSETVDADPEMTLTFLTEDGETVEITYTSYDTNFYLAERSDGRSYLVNKMDVRDLFDDYESLLDSIEEEAEETEEESEESDSDTESDDSDEDSEE